MKGSPLKRRTKDIEDRFWSKVDKGPDCWEWTAACYPCGYGILGVGRRDEGTIAAHRLSWKLEHGEIPIGLCVLHACDNRRCVRPSHLFLGTKKDNAQDAIQKGRLNQGEDSRHAKLKNADVRAIKKDNRVHAVIAQDYNVTRQAIDFIKNGRTWKHIA